MFQYCDAHGNTVDADEALDSCGNLRNGYGLRTPLHLMDSMQRDIAQEFNRRRMTRDGYTGDAATGFVDDRGVAFAPDPRAIATREALDHMQGRDEMLRQMYSDGRAAAEQARQEMIEASSNAWRGDARPSDGRSADAAPALAPRMTSMGEAQRIKREAYQQMVRDAENAWRRER
jgi:hypothetical protein